MGIHQCVFTLWESCQCSETKDWWNIIKDIRGDAERKFGVLTFWQVQLEPTSSWALIYGNMGGSSKYTGILQAAKEIFREEGLPV